MSMCSCLGDYEGDGGYLLRSTTVTARKTHHCGSCGTTIHPGDRYHLDQFADDGTITTYHTHEACMNLLTAVASHYHTGWFMGCDFNDCVDGWAQDPRFTDLIDEVFTLMNREDP